MADRGYGSQAVLDMYKGQEIQAKIPSKKNRRHQIFYDKCMLIQTSVFEWKCALAFKMIALSSYGVCKKYQLIYSNYSNKSD
jgi:hypothetical protein